jgi:hypothetical protein
MEFFRFSIALPAAPTPFFTSPTIFLNHFRIRSTQLYPPLFGRCAFGMSVQLTVLTWLPTVFIHSLWTEDTPLPSVFIPFHSSCII